MPEEDYDNSTTPVSGNLLLNEGNSQVCFNVMAMTDDILEATQSYSIDLTSSNANVDPAAANLTINILDINSTLSILYIPYIHYFHACNCTFTIIIM